MHAHMQLWLYADAKFKVTHFVQANQRTIAQLFVINPVEADIFYPVPDPIGTVNTQDELFSQLNFTVSQVSVFLYPSMHISWVL